jgi:Ser/Thr protein kinase RdoA (MazF antagonist)
MTAPLASAEATPTAMPPAFWAIVRRLEVDLAHVLGESPVSLSPLRYDDRPYSHLLHVAVCRPGSGAVLARLFVKRIKTKDDKSEDAIRERVVHEFTTSLRVHDAMQHYGDLGVVRPLVHYPDALTIATEEVCGETLGAYLQRCATGFPRRATVDDMVRTVGTVGRWVAALQNIESHTDAVALGDIRSYIDLRLGRLVGEARARFSEDDRVTLLRHIDRLSAAVAPPDLRSVLVHGDLALGNVIVNEGHVVVLDFAMAHTGTRLHDLTRLHLQLDLLCAKPQFRRAIVSRLQEALRRGFDPTLTTAHPLFRLLTLLHRVNNLATLSIRPSAFPASLYDAHVRRLHRRAITRELRQPVDVAHSQS